HDIWSAAEPVVRRWIARELSPAVRARELLQEGRAALTALAGLAEAERASPPPPPEEKPDSLGGFTGFLLGAAIPVLIFIMAWIVMHGGR
ncbi:MAG: ubiquinone biosynthesis protein UbiB, partial [Phenylobacterium sp.]